MSDFLGADFNSQLLIDLANSEQAIAMTNGVEAEMILIATMMPFIRKRAKSLSSGNSCYHDLCAIGYEQAALTARIYDPLRRTPHTKHFFSFTSNIIYRETFKQYLVLDDRVKLPRDQRIRVRVYEQVLAGRVPTGRVIRELLAENAIYLSAPNRSKVKKLDRDLACSAITIAEYEERLGKIIGVQLKTMTEVSRLLNVDSLDRDYYTGESGQPVSLIDTITAPDPQAEEYELGALKQHILDNLDNMILTDRERTVVLAILSKGEVLDEASINEIGANLGVKRKGMLRVIRLAMKEVGQMLGDSGYLLDPDHSPRAY